jgi:hypothetical protein
MALDRNRQQKATTNRGDLLKPQKLQHICARRALRSLTVTVACFTFIAALVNSSATAQTPASSSFPFEVSNPKHLQWSTARTVRPEKPPKLAPKFLLVLGTSDNETLRSGPTAEIHLKEWNPARFAEAMVLMATREILKTEDVVSLTRDTLVAAGASVSVSDLKSRK